jgi:hypothetical protein
VVVMPDGILPPLPRPLLCNQRECSGGKLQISRGFDPKPRVKTTHFVDTAHKSFNMLNLSNSI